MVRGGRTAGRLLLSTVRSARSVFPLNIPDSTGLEQINAQYLTSALTLTGGGSLIPKGMDVLVCYWVYPVLEVDRLIGLIVVAD